MRFLSKGQMSHEKNKAVEKFECRGLGNVPSPYFTQGLGCEELLGAWTAQVALLAAA